MHDWIVLDYSKYPNILKCNHCEETQELPRGWIPVSIFLSINKAFIDLHKKCRKEVSE